jgi:hypothetical protein
LYLQKRSLTDVEYEHGFQNDVGACSNCSNLLAKEVNLIGHQIDSLSQKETVTTAEIEEKDLESKVFYLCLHHLRLLTILNHTPSPDHGRQGVIESSELIYI